MNEYNKISKEKMNILSFFNFLEINCNIIIKAIETFNSIKEILELGHSLYLSYDYYIILKLNIDYIFNQDKNESRKILGDSLFKSGKDLVKQCLEYKEKQKIDKIFELNLKICFYFDKGTETFYETCSNIHLTEFVKMKFFSIERFVSNVLEEREGFWEICVGEDDLLFINNKLKEKDIYSLLISDTLGFNFEIKDEIQKQKILNLFNPFLEENQNL